MNRIYEIDEGRPFWKLRPAMLVVTLVTVVLTARGRARAGAHGTGRPRPSATRSASARPRSRSWNIAKWPVLLALVVLIVALLYYATPNVRQPQVPLDQRRRGRRDPHLGRRVGAVRPLRRELLQLRQDLRLAGRGDRVPALAVDHQPGAALRRGAGRRARTRPGAAGRACPPRRRSSCPRGTLARATERAIGRLPTSNRVAASGPLVATTRI